MTEEALMDKHRNIFDNMVDKRFMFEIECGAGWFGILDNLLTSIEAILKDSQDTFELQQIKEKFGTLRFYADFSNDKISDLIHEAECLSRTTCEKCGSPEGKLQKTTGYWYFTICNQCNKSATTKNI